jgi:hypothetical protein
VENVAPSYRDGKCTIGKCGTTVQDEENEGLENATTKIVWKAKIS